MPITAEKSMIIIDDALFDVIALYTKEARSSKGRIIKAGTLGENDAGTE